MKTERAVSRGPHVWYFLFWILFKTCLHDLFESVFKIFEIVLLRSVSRVISMGVM